MMWTALAIGFLGSLHCVGMCGAIALSLPLRDGVFSRLFASRVLYNLGRITTYSILGFLFGVVGSGLRLAGIQQGISIGLGVLMLVWLLTPQSIKLRFKELSIVASGVAKVRSLFAPLLSSKTLLSHFAIGVVNGLLPCGFVYMALAGALAQPTVADSIVFMAMFGAGTFPAMLALSLMPTLMPRVSGLFVRRFMPYATALVAVMFILRGMALGIPYISPKVHHTHSAIEPCCVDTYSCKDVPAKVQPIKK